MKKIFFHLLAMGLLVFYFSCKKEGSPMAKETDRDKMIENAKNAVRQIKDINGTAFNWNMAIIKKPVLSETAFEIRVWNMMGDEMLTYYDAGAMKMYQWKGEVHLVPAGGEIR